MMEGYMERRSSRRSFLGAGLALPAATLASSQSRDAVKLEHRHLGKTGLKVTSLGFGCMLVSDPIVVEKAYDLGINYFDTARLYQNGNNERMVGAALKGKRDKVVLTSKTRTFTKQDALSELDTSLRELGTDYLDIWFLHIKNEPADVTEELLDAQRIAKQAGKIRFAGVSFHLNMATMLAHVAKLGQTDVALASYNFTMDPAVSEAIRAARKTGMGVVAMKVMAGGYARILKGDRLYGQKPNELLSRLKQPGAMLSALKWVLRNESVDTAIIGITDLDELDEDIRAMAEPFGKDDEKVLTAYLDRIRPLYCRMCGECGGGCERGVRVADSLRFLTYADGYGQFAMARDEFLRLPEGSGPDVCGSCDECTVQCPNGVDVRARLTRAQELFA